MGIAQPSRAAFGELAASNDILDDAPARARRWEREGYWFFRDVLDLEALEQFRAPVLEELKRIGLVDPNQVEPRWNGRARERFPAPTHAGYEAFPALVRNRRWRDFLAHPKISGFFARALGTQAQWVPVAELRVMPPWEETPGEPFTYIHQDGFYNEGFRCLTAWMPLWPIRREAGGLTVAAGYHQGDYLHDLTRPPRFPIPDGAIAQNAWRTTDYRPGDVVIFDLKLPHSGMRNRSRDYFRISFDVRCNFPGDPAPVVGTLISATTSDIVVREEGGAERRLALTAASYCRGLGRDAGKRLSLEAVPDVYRPGQEVMVTLEGGTVKLLREPKY